jgi:hypothetical protein
LVSRPDLAVGRAFFDVIDGSLAPPCLQVLLAAGDGHAVGRVAALRQGSVGISGPGARVPRVITVTRGGRGEATLQRWCEHCGQE